MLVREQNWIEHSLALRAIAQSSFFINDINPPFFNEFHIECFGIEYREKDIYTIKNVMYKMKFYSFILIILLYSDVKTRRES